MTTLSQEVTIKYRIDSTRAVQNTVNLAAAQKEVARTAIPLEQSFGSLETALSEVEAGMRKTATAMPAVSSASELLLENNKQLSMSAAGLQAALSGMTETLDLIDITEREAAATGATFSSATNTVSGASERASGALANMAGQAQAAAAAQDDATASSNTLAVAQNLIATQATPAMAGSFATLSQEVINLSGAQKSMGFSLSAMGPAFVLVGNAIAAINPIVLGATLAAAGLAAVWLASKDDLNALTEALEEHEDGLRRVAESTSIYADEAKRLLDIRHAGLLIRKAELEADLALIQSGKRHAETMDNVKSAVTLWATALAGILLPALTASGVSIDGVREKITDAFETLSSGLVGIDPGDMDEALTGAIGALGDALKEIDEFGPKTEKAGQEILRLRDQILRLKESISQDTVGVEELEEFYQERISIIEAAAAIEIEKAGENAELIALIEEKKTLQLTALFQDYAMTRSELEAGYVTVVETTAAQALQTWANTFKARESLEKRALRIQGNFLKSSQRAFAEAEAGRISLLQAGAKTAILTAAEEVAGILEKKALWWSAEAIAAAARYDFVAMGLYAAAAAAAVGAAGLVRSAAAGAFSPEDNRSAEEDSSLAGSPAAEGTRRGSTVVSEGPLTLNYSATQIINGNVFGTEDLYDLWSTWNEDQLRAAAGEARERTRG